MASETEYVKYKGNGIRAQVAKNWFTKHLSTIIFPYIKAFLNKIQKQQVVLVFLPKNGHWLFVTFNGKYRAGPCGYVVDMLAMHALD